MRRICGPVLVLLALSACGEGLGEARYDRADCRRVDLTDADTGKPIIGAEDLVHDRVGGRLIVSAYDRRQAERMAKAKTDAAPVSGGVYAVDLDRLFDSETALDIDPLFDAEEIDGGLRPHGVDYQDGRLAFINRAYRKTGVGNWTMEPVLVEWEEGGPLRASPVHCAANDVAMGPETLLVSFDHGACGAGAIFENIFARRKSGLMTADDQQVVLRDIGFANGVVAQDELVWLAATREDAIYEWSPEKAAGTAPRRIATPGSPDNLSLSERGGLVAALHPSLIRLALARKLGVGRAPSRIVSIDPGTGEAALLFDDSDGALFSAATIGLETGRGLVAGSVLDRGLLVCEAKT